jgi:type II secretory pathway component PulL
MVKPLVSMMREINIEFIEDRRWRFLWSAMAIVCAGLLIAMTWLGYQISQEKREINLQIQSARLMIPSAPLVGIQKQDARYASSIKAASLLQFDLNKVFSTIENIAEPSTRLINITFDASAGSLRLEYELDSIEVAVVLTEKLNTGFEIRPWQLESLSAARSNISNGILSPAAKTIGIWRCQIKNI